MSHLTLFIWSCQLYCYTRPFSIIKDSHQSAPKPTKTYPNSLTPSSSATCIKPRIPQKKLLALTPYQSATYVIYEIVFVDFSWILHSFGCIFASELAITQTFFTL
jgi:hypothetical protein